MIRFVSDQEHGAFAAEASGNLTEIIAEIGLCMNTAYNLIQSRDPAAALCFKKALIITFRPDSPVWDKEDVPDPKEGIKIVRVRDLGKEASHE